MTPKLRLLPSADVAELGEHCYLFDRAAMQENVVFVPTQRVSRRMFDVVRRLKTEYPFGEPQRYDALEGLFDTAAEKSTLAQLARAGYLEPVPDTHALRSIATQAAATAAPEVDYFRTQVLKHFLKRASFFHLPAQIGDDDCDVAIVGVPVSSTLVSSGTQDAPSRLRRDSQRAGFWFDFHAHGIYTETGCDGTTPRLICAGTRLKDFGDIGGNARTVGDLFAEVAALVEQRLLPNRIRSLFIGGDHAITFPIVDCYLRHYPDLVMVHLDAHNDLFYTERVEFNHAGPIHALLAHSGLQRVLSFGLRTAGDPRVAPFNRLQQSGLLDARVRLHSLNALRRWLARPDEFRAYLQEQVGSDRPCYLTIDLDVLSAEAIAGQLSTPAGPGLEWSELLEMVGHVMSELNVVAGDIVELNPDHKNRLVQDERELTVLLLEMIDGLGRQRRQSITAANGEPIRAVDAAATALPPAPPSASDARGSLRLLDIDRRDARTLGYRRFLTEYALPGRPVVLTGVGENWPALTRWSLETFFAAIDEDETIEVRQFSRADDFGSVRTSFQGARATLARMIQRQRGGLAPDDSRDYIVNWQFADTCAALLRDYTTPEFFHPALNGAILPPPSALRWLFVGEPGTGSATHTDIWNSSAWLMLISGRKHWRLVPAADAAACGRIGAWVDLFAPDATRYERFSGVTLYETEQLPGELMWAPPSCVHAVRNIEHSVAITQNYVDLSNLDHVYDALSSGPGALACDRRLDGAMLAHWVRLGLDDLKQRRLQEAVGPVIAHLNDALAARLQRETSRAIGLEAALRELRRWQGSRS